MDLLGCRTEVELRVSTEHAWTCTGVVRLWMLSCARGGRLCSVGVYEAVGSYGV